MATEATAEYKDLNVAQQKALRTYLDAMQISKEYVKPYFEKFVRFGRLFNGTLPPEMDGTFSKIMLNMAYSMVDNEMPRSLRALLGTTEWFSTTATDPALEEYSKQTKKWLQYQMEEVQRISQTIIPTTQAAHVFGTSYRVYGCRMIPKFKNRRQPAAYAMGIPVGFSDVQDKQEKYVISGQDVNIFNIWPFPGGGLVNAFDDSQASCCDGVIWQSYMSKAEIDANVANEQWDGDQARRLYDRKSGGDKNDPAQEYKSKVVEDAIGWQSFSTPSWMDRMRSETVNLPSRYRVAWLFMRERWIVIGEDKFVLYDDVPALPFIPIAKFISSYNMSEWFGKGLIELTEDLILTTMILLNHRMDYLAGTLHPTTWISERVSEFLGGDKSITDPEPYKQLIFPTNANITQEVIRERFPEISQQAFYEDQQMDMWLQKISGQPNFSKGMGGPGALGNETASGIMSLIQEGTARSMMRSANIEESGLRDSLNITLRLGAIYKVLQDSWIRTGGSGAFPWEQIPQEAISEEYRIAVAGTRSMTAQAETFKRMLQVIQVTMTAPPGVIDSPKEMMRQLVDKSAAFEGVDEIIGHGQPAMPQPMQTNPMQSIQPGGQTDMQNQMSSVNNRMGMNAMGQAEPVTGGVPV